ncbi:ThuA domain-containing protein [Gramella jeungdoensis]|uniref:ThuA domain-containing protein n=1 Tax=Gramella jeungdoensis TaxID=708091 RepID=A0ABT0Z1I8_9FLAO|nr:ThuA domain-containing protein [Gramella jeungdoensis]MCM8569569.1 ThuA domain-containing protein [Gramella jeungdoensis]
MRFIIAIAFLIICNTFYAQNKVLIFHETEGYRHKSIEAGIQAIQRLGNENDFNTIVSRDSRFFTENDLDDIDLVIFLNTTGDILNTDEEVAFQGYMDNGGNFFGIHAAADTEYDWAWYGKLVGAYFKGHPKVQTAVVNVMMPDHMTVDHLPEQWKREDEWYNYKDIRPDLKVLMSLDEKTYEGGENGDNHPIAWFQNYTGGGRSVYTGGGHTVESYSDPDFLEHLRRCIRFALSD